MFILMGKLALNLKKKKNLKKVKIEHIFIKLPNASKPKNTFYSKCIILVLVLMLLFVGYLSGQMMCTFL